MPPSRIGGKVKRPSSSHFVARIMPLPSQTRIFNLSDRFAPKDEDIATIGIFQKRLPNHRRQTVDPAPKVDRLGCDQDLPGAAKRHHDRERTAATTALARRGSISPPMTMRLPTNSNSINTRRSSPMTAPVPGSDAISSGTNIGGSFGHFRSASARSRQPNLPAPGRQKTAVHAVPACHAGYVGDLGSAFAQNPRFLLIRPISASPQTGNQLDPAITSDFIPGLETIIKPDIFHPALSNEHPEPMTGPSSEVDGSGKVRRSRRLR